MFETFILLGENASINISDIDSDVLHFFNKYLTTYRKAFDDRIKEKLSNNKT